jgi:hypothetical protein
LLRRAKVRQFQTVILCYVQIPSQLFDLRAVCRGNNELFLVPCNKTLKYLNYFLLVSIVKNNNILYKFTNRVKNCVSYLIL